jgi:APA family basic amino acid/polyamine antiporter
MWQLPGLTWIRFGVWTVIGILIYLGYGLKQSRLAEIEPHAPLACTEKQR